jgi:hypothetical protein
MIRTRSRFGRGLGWLVVLGLTTAALFFPVSPALATHVTPIAITSGNPTCGDFDGTYGGGQTWLEVKDESPSNGTLTVPGFGTITISNFSQSDPPDPGSFDWSSTFGIDAVFVKAGNDMHNLYVYAASAAATESMGDTELEPQEGQGNGISHISFCYDAGAAAPTPTDAVPTPTDAVPTPTDAVPTPTDSLPTPTGAVGGATATPTGGAGAGTTTEPTLPATSTIDGQGDGPLGGGWRIILLAMAALLAVALLLTPARAVVRKDDDSR